MQHIIQGCKNNEATAQRQLFVHYAPLMMTVCRRYAKNTAEAEDILQEAFLNIFRNFNQYNPEKSPLEAWVRKVTVNKAIEFWRKNKRNPLDFGENLPNQATFAPEAELKMDEEAILTLIQELPEAQQLVFNLFAIEGFSHKEIAETLGIGEGSSRTYLTRARQFLQQRIAVAPTSKSADGNKSRADLEVGATEKPHSQGMEIQHRAIVETTT